MRTPKILLFFVAAMTLLLYHPPPLVACSCGRISIEDAFGSHDVVFVGEVVDIEANVGPIGRWWQQMRWRMSEGPDYGDMSTFYMTVTVKVKRSWKGTLPEAFQVQTPDAKVCCICGYPFEVGKSYLIYASGPKLQTSICSRTKELSEAKDEITVLNRLARKPKQ